MRYCIKICERKENMSLIANIIENFRKVAWPKISKYFKDCDAEDKIRYGIAYETYLRKTYERNRKIKTIIYRDRSENLYSFYEHINVRYHKQVINTQKIENLIRIGNKLIVSGLGGVGKSTLFKHLFLDTIQNTSYIPVLLEFRNFDNELTVEDEIYKSLCDNGFDLEREYFQNSMKDGAYVILLDGYDELSENRVDKISKEIKSLSNKYDKNIYIISSRPFEGFISWNDFCELIPLGLNKTQAIRLVNKMKFDKSVKESFCEELENGLFEEHYSFASNPLLLSIMLLTYRKHATISSNLSEFYDEAFVTLFNAHDATKDSYKRIIKSQLGSEEFKTVFSHICFKTFFSRKFEFLEGELNEYINRAKSKHPIYQFDIDDFKYDLIHSVCLLIKDGNKYRFSHRSFQEYFAAFYTRKLDDEIQQKLIKGSLESEEGFLLYSESYLTMLFELQSEKVNRIIICPILKEIKELYEKHGFSIELMEILYNSASFISPFDDERIVLAVSENKNYFAPILNLNARLNKKPENHFKPNAEELLNRVLEYKGLNDSGIDSLGISFRELAEIVTENRLLQEFNWVKDSLEFALKILDKYEKSNSHKLNSVEDILEDL